MNISVVREVSFVFHFLMESSWESMDFNFEFIIEYNCVWTRNKRKSIFRSKLWIEIDSIVVLPQFGLPEALNTGISSTDISD